MSHRNEQLVYFLFVLAEPDAASQESKTIEGMTTFN